MEPLFSRIRQNYLANLVAAIGCFLVQAGWYSVFLQKWLDGVGRTREWLTSSGLNPAIQYATALLCGFVAATVLSGFIQVSGPQTLWRGIKVAVGAWLGFVLPIWGTEYIVEVRPWSLYAINCGFWLIGLVLMGAIVGAWRKKELPA
jgi:Protein of unknown function (DUF1761)